MKYCKQLAFRSLQVLWLDDSILLLKYQFIAHLLHHFSIIMIISNNNPLSSISGYFSFSIFKLSAPPPVLHPSPTFQYTGVFTFCSCQTEWPAGRWHSGMWRAAPPSSWRGSQTDWCRYRMPSSSQILEGRSRSHPRGWCCWNGGTPPTKQEWQHWGWVEHCIRYSACAHTRLTCRYFISGRPVGTRVRRLLSRWSSLSLGR